MQCSSVDTDQHAQEYKGTWRLDDKVIWPILCKLGDFFGWLLKKLSMEK